MKLEHVALNVDDPVAMGRWYVEHLGLKVKRRMVEQPYAHFLADDSGSVMIEIYSNREQPRLDHAQTTPAALHLAFVSQDMEIDVRRLERAGATMVGQIDTAPNGDQFVFLRDPWGVCLQLVKRTTPMIS